MHLTIGKKTWKDHVVVGRYTRKRVVRADCVGWFGLVPYIVIRVE